MHPVLVKGKKLKSSAYKNVHYFSLESPYKASFPVISKANSLRAWKLAFAITGKEAYKIYCTIITCCSGSFNSSLAW